MIGKPFVNEVISEAIGNYLKYKEKQEDPNFWTFPVMAIRTLIFIYGELDIINPYITQNEHNMGGFDSNLKKYGFRERELEEFKQAFLNYKKEIEENKYPNVSFLTIEKSLIRMYFDKKRMMNLGEEKDLEFKNYLYLETNENSYIKQDRERFCKDKKELDLYYTSISFEAKHNFTLEEIRRSTLIPEAYILLGYSMEQITALNDIDLRNVNNQIYQFFRIDPNQKDKEELLIKAVNYYKKYGNKVTSGNGYVDFLLFASILATAIFTTFLVIINL